MTQPGTTTGAQLAVVFGAGGGIGSELVRLLAADGCRVALVDKDAPSMTGVAADIGAAAAGVYSLDITVDAEVQALARRIGTELGPPTLLINSVGWLGPLEKTTWECSAEEWQEVLAVNLLGPISCVRAFLPLMADAAGARRIVIVSSLGAFFASAALGAYAAAKRALVSFAETLDLELTERGLGIDVSVVLPGSVRTRLNAELRASRTPEEAAAGDWLDAASAALRIRDGMAAGRFYVYTHASSKTYFQPYADRVIASF